MQNIYYIFLSRFIIAHLIYQWKRVLWPEIIRSPSIWIWTLNFERGKQNNYTTEAKIAGATINHSQTLRHKTERTQHNGNPNEDDIKRKTRTHIKRNTYAVCKFYMICSSIRVGPSSYACMRVVNVTLVNSMYLYNLLYVFYYYYVCHFVRDDSKQASETTITTKWEWKRKKKNTIRTCYILVRIIKFIREITSHSCLLSLFFITDARSIGGTHVKCVCWVHLNIDSHTCLKAHATIVSSPDK